MNSLKSSARLITFSFVLIVSIGADGVQGEGGMPAGIQGYWEVTGSSDIEGKTQKPRPDSSLLFIDERSIILISKVASKVPEAMFYKIRISDTKNALKGYIELEDSYLGKDGSVKRGNTEFPFEIISNDRDPRQRAVVIFRFDEETIRFVATRLDKRTGTRKLAMVLESELHCSPNLRLKLNQLAIRED